MYCNRHGHRVWSREYSSDDGDINYVHIADSDGDGLLNDVDNCLLVVSPDQRDSNSDGYGNVCDADLNNDGVVNAIDPGLLRIAFFTTDEDADFNGDGVVNAVDLGILRLGFFLPPGSSGIM